MLELVGQKGVKNYHQRLATGGGVRLKEVSALIKIKLNKKTEEKKSEKKNNFFDSVGN